MVRLTGEERKMELIKAAIRVFAEENYSAAKVAEITAACGVTEPMLYRHFGSKKELYLAVLKRILEKTIERLARAAAAAENPIDSLWAVALEQSTMLTRFQNELKIQFQAFSEIDDPDVRKIITEGYENGFHLVEGILEDGKQQGVFRSDLDASLHARMMIGNAVHINAYFLDGILDDGYPERVFKEQLRMILVSE